MHNDSIEKPGRLRDQFTAFGDVPSSDVWNNIVIEINPKKKRRRFLWIFLSIIGFASLGSLLFLKPVNEKSTNIQQAATKTNLNLISKKNHVKNETPSLPLKKSGNDEINFFNQPNPLPKTVLNSTVLFENGNTTIKNRITDNFNQPTNTLIEQAKTSFVTPNLDSITSDSSNYVNKISNYKLQSSHFQNLGLIYNSSYMFTESNKGFKFSIVGGVNYRLAKYTSFENYYQFYFGALVKYKFQNNFALESGLMAIKNRRDVFNGSGLSNLNLNASQSDLLYRYDDLIIALPIKASFKIYQNNRFQTELFGGFQFQYMAKKRDLSFGQNSPSTVDYSASYTSVTSNNFINKFNVMSQIGFNLYFKSSKSFRYRVSPYYQYYTIKCDRFSLVTGGTKHWAGIQFGIEF